nr:hypothetical protein [Tanacetum cinerariifolium]
RLFTGQRNLLGINGHDDALGAESRSGFADKLGIEHGSGVDRHLIGAGIQQIADVLHRAHAATHRQRNEHLTGHALNGMQRGVAAVDTGRDVQKGNLVGALLVIATGNFHRIAGVADVLELHAFDYAAVVDVKARDDAFGEGHGPVLRRRLGICPTSQHSDLKDAPVGVSLLAMRLSAFVRITKRLGLSDIQRAFVNGAAGNGADDAGRFGVEQRLDVAQVMNTAGGDHRNACGGSERGGERDVAALHHAVFGDVGINDRRDAVGFEALRQIDHLHGADLSPTVGGDEAVFGIQADDHFAGKCAAGFCDEFGLLDRLGADDDVTHAGFDVVLDGFQRANAATDLDRQVWVATGNRRHDFTIDRLAFKRTIEVDQMQTTAAALNPFGSHAHRIIGEHCGIFHSALAQTHACAVFKVDRGNNKHGFSLVKGAASCKP